MRRIWTILGIVAAAAAVAIGARLLLDGPDTQLAVAATNPDVVVPAKADGVRADVYLTPTCGCCGDWAKHLEEHGFEVVRHYVEDLYPVKVQHRVPPALGSCHTAVIDGYVVEGHTPADVVLRLLAERPAVAGIGVPGMPMGSPGMEGPPGSRVDRYEIYAFDQAGNTTVYDRR